jgi:prepilin-type N-terminal cleavage/methylation domain-containing protein
MKKRLLHTNSGFSLVEIIVTVMIASVITGTVGFGISLSSGKPAEKCARSLASALSHARTNTMGKYRNNIVLTNTGSGYTVSENILVGFNADESENTSQRSTTIGSSNVTIEYYTGTASYTTLDVGDSLVIRFDSGSGALSEPSGTNGQLIFRISKSGTVKYVTIAQLTGNITTS